MTAPGLVRLILEWVRDGTGRDNRFWQTVILLFVCKKVLP